MLTSGRGELGAQYVKQLLAMRMRLTARDELPVRRTNNLSRDNNRKCNYCSIVQIAKLVDLRRDYPRCWSERRLLDSWDECFVLALRFGEILDACHRGFTFSTHWEITVV